MRNLDVPDNNNDNANTRRDWRNGKKREREKNKTKLMQQMQKQTLRDKKRINDWLKKRLNANTRLVSFIFTPFF